METESSRNDLRREINLLHCSIEASECSNSEFGKQKCLKSGSWDSFETMLVVPIPEREFNIYALALSEGSEF